MSDSTPHDSQLGNDSRSDSMESVDSLLIADSICRDDVRYATVNNHFTMFDSDLLTTVSDGNNDGDLAVVRDNLATFELFAGDMLYLPTGWFHQVTSRKGRHMAINYWWRALNWREAVDFEDRASRALFDTLLGVS